jgi:hypothetical protein
VAGSLDDAVKDAHAWGYLGGASGPAS